MIRVADYVAQTLVQHGITDVFLLTGGGAMHLNDAFGRTKGMHYTACHHEQTCAMAAESYFRMTQKMAAVNVTTGPGGTNAITGVYGAFVDSCAMIVISGQVKYETTVASTNLKLRQLGDQEVDIIPMVKGITKYAVSITDPSEIRFHLEKALFLALNGRPGPVWIDIPMNVQGALVDPSKLKGFDADSFTDGRMSRQDLEPVIKGMLGRLQEAKRPVLMVGTGIKISGQNGLFLDLAERLGIPVVTGWNAHDTLPDSHPLNCGKPGTVGDRAGNFTVQNSDFLLVLGCRLNIRQVSYNWQGFAPHAFQVMVDVDEAELKKPTLEIDLPIHADLRDFLFVLSEQTHKWSKQPAHQQYLDWCLVRRKKYPVVLKEYWKSSKVNPYCFVDRLFAHLKEGEKIVTGDGTACVVTFQAAEIKAGQRLYTNSGCASMGYDLPAAIGAAIALKREGKLERVICIAGDGSIQLNLQELQTIQTHQLPIKIFVLNNQGYHSIRQTQQNYFSDNIVGCGIESGLGFPSFKKITDVYGLKYFSANNHEQLDAAISSNLETQGATLCEIHLDLQQQFAPKLASRKLADGKMVSSPLEDLAPFLSREELAQNMITPTH